MKTIQLTFLFEDTGFCKDVFQSVNQPYYYCNRDTVDGTCAFGSLPSEPHFAHEPALSIRAGSRSANDPGSVI